MIGGYFTGYGLPQPTDTNQPSGLRDIVAPDTSGSVLVLKNKTN